ncbi:hypothetical protein DQ04_12071000 [Trypanosoma grayi]|uniref:hypothetical protein n=1 Tax=Trypanosoma grayi TaxID=71804 RepID=UPI0004F418EB|nr:hypothetical protein DQ04_12071000 [Trypanosoma grayi]KEG06819.1 hypothetical protein DQ04_12071000 [Trypanosoma grayi]
MVGHSAAARNGTDRIDASVDDTRRLAIGSSFDSVIGAHRPKPSVTTPSLERGPSLLSLRPPWPCTGRNACSCSATTEAAMISSPTATRASDQPLRQHTDARKAEPQASTRRSAPHSANRHIPPPSPRLLSSSVTPLLAAAAPLPSPSGGTHSRQRVIFTSSSHRAARLSPAKWVTAVGVFRGGLFSSRLLSPTTVSTAAARSASSWATVSSSTL